MVGYESEDERMGRRGRSKRGTPYSKVDIREQYCINNKEVQVLESGSPSALFGCLSKHHDSSCSSRHSFLSVCVGRAPSDENLHDICRQPLPRRPVDDLERAYMRRRPKSICGADTTRYAWIPEDEEPLKPVGKLFGCLMIKGIETSGAIQVLRIHIFYSFSTPFFCRKNKHLENSLSFA